jgi:hypothetical protein
MDNKNMILEHLAIKRKSINEARNTPKIEDFKFEDYNVYGGSGKILKTIQFSFKDGYLALQSGTRSCIFKIIPSRSVAFKFNATSVSASDGEEGLSKYFKKANSEDGANNSFFGGMLERALATYSTLQEVDKAVDIDVIKEVIKFIGMDKILGLPINKIITSSITYLKIRVVDKDNNPIDIKYVVRLSQNLKDKGIDTTVLQDLIEKGIKDGGHYQGLYVVIDKANMETITSGVWV